MHIKEFPFGATDAELFLHKFILMTIFFIVKERLWQQQTTIQKT